MMDEKARKRLRQESDKGRTDSLEGQYIRRATSRLTLTICAWNNSLNDAI